ncbi:hypothetical protein LKD70_09110 [Ruminococcus sp. CLA-AA-H200]|uniref:Uncharacterized protein n=1 Tax=Ruminococcus turbiniformis TaxID=2881258 RepID=A0ABS8FX77_9FIRM|nr:hypothetical protein [Ruminococcus turbiniformis]MCC2254573.1 hypothetical protein [Ruminococcus turbiniformis]
MTKETRKFGMHESSVELVPEVEPVHGKQSVSNIVMLSLFITAALSIPARMIAVSGIDVFHSPILFLNAVFFITASVLLPVRSVFAAQAIVADLLENAIEQLGTIFIGVGILLLAFGIGQMILGFKNDDPDTKQRAATLCIVSAFLIAFPQVVETFDLLSYLQ